MSAGVALNPHTPVDLLKDTIIWEIERGKNLTDEDIKVAKKKRFFLAKKINKIF